MTHRRHHIKIPKRKYKKHRNMLSELLAKHKPDYIIGIDEVGWGAIAGPLVVGSAVYPVGYTNTGIRDSKSYTEKSRSKALVLVEQTAIYTDIQTALPEELEKNGAGPTLQACYLALANRALAKYPNSILIMDGTNLVRGYEGLQAAFAKADKFVCAVSAASIVAKVTRDITMVQLHKQAPEFDWKTNKGYPTPAHMAALLRLGASVHHRMNVDSVREIRDTVGSYERKMCEDQAY